MREEESGGREGRGWGRGGCGFWCVFFFPRWRGRGGARKKGRGAAAAHRPPPSLLPVPPPPPCSHPIPRRREREREDPPGVLFPRNKNVARLVFLFACVCFPPPPPGGGGDRPRAGGGALALLHSPPTCQPKEKKGGSPLPSKKKTEESEGGGDRPCHSAPPFFPSNVSSSRPSFPKRIMDVATLHAKARQGEREGSGAL